MKIRRKEAEFSAAAALFFNRTELEHGIPIFIPDPLCYSYTAQPCAGVKAQTLSTPAQQKNSVGGDSQLSQLSSA